MCVSTIGSFSLVGKKVKHNCKLPVTSWFVGFSLILDFPVYFDYLTRITLWNSQWGIPIYIHIYIYIYCLLLVVYPIGINILPIGYSLFPIGGAWPGAGPASCAGPSLRGPSVGGPPGPSDGLVELDYRATKSHWLSEKTDSPSQPKHRLPKGFRPL